MEAIKLDKRDRKILTILADDPRISYTDLAKHLKISKNAAKYRLDGLFWKKVVGGVHPVINYFKLGMTTYEVFLKARPTGKAKLELEHYLTTNKNMLWTTATFGQYDYFFEVLCKDHFELDQIMSGIREMLGSSFREFKIVIGTRRLKIQPLVAELQESVPDWIPPKASEPNLARASLDELDKSLLKELCKNGRATYRDISEEIGTTLQTVKNRIKNLLSDTTIIRFMPTFGYRELGYVSYILLLKTRLTSPEQESKLAEQFKALGPVKLALHVVNTNELELFVCVRHPDELEQLAIGLKEKFPEQIADVEFMHIVKEFRLNFYPEGLL